MTKNITIRVDEALIKQCRHLAVEKDRSLSQWVADVMRQQVERSGYQWSIRKPAAKRGR